MKRLLRVPFLVLATLLFSIVQNSIAATPTHITPDGQKTIGLIVESLNRLGETTIARRLNADYKSGKVRFGIIRDYVIFANADTTAFVKSGQLGQGASDTNTMVIAKRYEDEHERVPNTRPYNPDRSSLISLAVTMVHEYTHMTQRGPDSSPTFEDPAWRASEAALGRWLNRLAKEMDVLSKKPASAARNAALEEVLDLVRSVRSECGTQKEGYQTAVNNKTLTPNKSWQWDNHIKLADHIIGRVAKAKAGAVSSGSISKTSIPPGGAWGLSTSVVWTDNPGLDKYIQEASTGPAKVKGSVMQGVAKFTWINPNIQGSPTTSLAVTWTQPPDMVVPGGELVISAKGSDTGSSANAGPGDFVCFGVSLYGSNDDKNWTFLAGNFPTVCASPHKIDAKTYRIPLPATRWKTLALQVHATSGFWGKSVNYNYVWKDGPT